MKKNWKHYSLIFFLTSELHVCIEHFRKRQNKNCLLDQTSIFYLLQLFISYSTTLRTHFLCRCLWTRLRSSVRALGTFFYVTSIIPWLSSSLLTGQAKKESSRAAEGMAQFACSHDIDEVMFHCGKIILLNHDSWRENSRKWSSAAKLSRLSTPIHWEM